jgi:hypothetical protein
MSGSKRPSGGSFPFACFHSESFSTYRYAPSGIYIFNFYEVADRPSED